MSSILRNYSLDELHNRYDELEAWATLEAETRGSCRYDEVHRLQREALGDTDPDDPFSDLWAIDEELSRRAVAVRS